MCGQSAVSDAAVKRYFAPEKEASLLSCEDDHGAVASFYLQECVKTYSFRDQAFVLVILDVVTKKYLTRYIDKKSRYMRKVR